MQVFLSQNLLEQIYGNGNANCQTRGVGHDTGLDQQQGAVKFQIIQGEPYAQFYGVQIKLLVLFQAPALRICLGFDFDREYVVLALEKKVDFIRRGVLAPFAIIAFH